jgi:hypothetical protein
MTDRQAEAACETGPETGSVAEQAVPVSAGADPAAPAARLRKRHVALRAGKHAGRAGLGLFFALIVLAAVALLGVLALTGRPIGLPVWAVAEIETRANVALGKALPGAALSVGAIEITLEDGWAPHLRLEDLRLLQDDGTTLLALPDIRLSFDATALLRERSLRPASLHLIGGDVALKRLEDGRLDLRFGAANKARPIKNLAELMRGVDAALALPVLSRLTSVQAQAMSMTLEDARTGRLWTLGDGQMRLENRASEVAAELGLSLEGGGATPAQALVTIVHPKGEPLARISATVNQVAASDLAVQTPVLAALGALDAPISGRIEASVTDAGVAALNGEMSLGAGALRPTPAARPIVFNHAAIKLGYDQGQGRIALTGLSIDSPSLRLEAQGYAYPLDSAGAIMTGALGQRLPASFIGQVAITKAQIDPEGVFDRPLIFTQGAMDARLSLNPFTLDIGQINLIEERGRRLSIRGQAKVLPEGWQLAIDLALDAIAHDRLLQLWPKTAVAQTRNWVGDNVAKGLLTNVTAALRVTQGQEPHFALGYEFDDAEVRFLKTLPPVRNGRGRSSIEGHTYSIIVDSGTVDAPQGGQIDVAGSVFQVPDILAKPAQADIRLRTRSTITAALSLLDLPPFRFMEKAGRSPDLGAGQAVVDTHLTLPLQRRVELEDVTYQVAGTLSDLSSTVLVPGKTITADRLTLKADRAGLAISGPGLIGKVPFDVTFTQGFGPEAKGRSQIKGTVALSPVTVQEFGLGLPEDMVSGAGQADVVIDLAKGSAGRLTLSSTLAGIGLRLGAVGWSKPANARGVLEVSAGLGTPPEISKLRLEAAGLTASGKIDLEKGGGLKAATFDRVTLNGWLDAPVTLRGTGAGRAPDILLRGGSFDLRRFGSGKGGGSGKGSGEASKLDVQLDRFVVTDDIALTGFSGIFSQRGGLNGTFRAAVNGAARVAGSVAPGKFGTAVRVQSDDAGATLKAAGIFASARGGTMDLLLNPLQDAGNYAGHVELHRFTVKDASVLADLLSAVSVVGLLEQLGGDGIPFSDAVADFLITPRAIEVSKASAIGASLGFSMAGLYGTQTKRLAMQGVISPLYLLNGIGSVLTKRGEGLFGFNYALSGTASDPQVSVNPLSILTPGMFREIFRSPAPALKRQGQ